MSITKKLISHRVSNGLAGNLVVEAQLVLTNRESISASELIENRTSAEDAINRLQDLLDESLMHHIYGDLIPLINELAILAQHHITGMNDQGEINELKMKISDILKGVDNEPEGSP